MEQSELLRHLVNTLEWLGLRYFVTGSLASTYYGEPRFTHDIDVVVDLPASSVGALCIAFPFPDYSVKAINDGHRNSWTVQHLSASIRAQD